MSFFDKLKQGVSEAGTLAKNQIEANKLKLEISKYKSEIESIKKNLGYKVFDNRLNPDFGLALFEQDFNRIDELQQKIIDVEGNIHEIFNQKLCACGELNSIEVKFCNACGRPVHGDQIAASMTTAPIATESGDTVLMTEDAVEVAIENETVEKPKEEASSNFCTECGIDNPLNVQFCGGCGTALN